MEKKNGSWFIEIQGSNDKHFSERMFQYWYRIYDRYKTEITALAVFTGKKDQSRPDHFRKSFLGTEIIYRYNVYHIFEDSEDGLLAMENPFALIVLAAQKALLAGKISEKELNKERLLVAKALINSKKYSHERISRFLYFLKQFVHIEDPEINRNFDKQIDTLTGKQNTMGIIETIKMIEREEAFEKGVKKGIEQKNRQVVLNLLNTEEFTISKIANFANVSESFVRKIKKELKK